MEADKEEARHVEPLLGLFGGPITCYSSTYNGNAVFFPQHLRRRPKKICNILLDNSNILVKAISSPVIKPLHYTPASEMKHSAILGAFSLLLARKFGLHENTSCVVSGCLRLLSGPPDALTHSIRSIPKFLSLLVSCEEL